MLENESPSPDLFWRTLTGFQHTAALNTALELDIFTAISDGAATAGEIASASNSSERGVRIICDTLTVLGFLTKDDGKYALTESSELFLSKKSPTYIGSVANFIYSPPQRRGYDDLTNAVRSGGSQVTGGASLDPESPMWVEFARAMVPMMMPAAQTIAQNLGVEKDAELKVLDVAAGHGIFGITVAQHFPKAQIYALDWPNVLTVATENAEKFGVSDRHHLIPGSAFDAEMGDGYDIVLLTNFLHHFDADTNTTLLKRIANALAPGGKVITLEFIPNDDRISPPSEALFSLVMLAATPAGDAYTYRELRSMFEDAGFSRNEQIALDPMPQHLLISTR